jgi:ABC-type transport system involved in cytochrome c biogenesis ATPase subunit
MSSTAAPRYLRRSGHEVLDRLTDGIRLERGEALVVCGEAGIGKTALLRQALDAVPGLRTPW